MYWKLYRKESHIFVQKNKKTATAWIPLKRKLLKEKWLDVEKSLSSWKEMWNGLVVENGLFFMR